MLQETYSPVRGDWTLPLENEFQQLRTIEPQLLAYQNDPARPRRTAARCAQDEMGRRVAARYDWLRLARLYHYLRVRRPEASIGGSILVYRLDAAEVTGATAGLAARLGSADSSARWRANRGSAAT